MASVSCPACNFAKVSGCRDFLKGVSRKNAVAEWLFQHPNNRTSSGIRAWTVLFVSSISFESRREYKGSVLQVRRTAKGDAMCEL